MENITATPPTTPRPFGFWLRATDRLIAREFERAFESEGATRRDWRMLNLLADDTIAPEVAARLQRRGGGKIRALIERGWVTEVDGAWTLTDEGRAAHARLSEAAGGVRAKVAAAVSPEDFAITVASLEAIARELGWDPAERLPRSGRRGPRGLGHRHGAAHRHGFGPRHDFSPRHDCGPRHREGFGPRVHADECYGRAADRHAHGRGGHSHDHHTAERAFERGFQAGFSRGAEAHRS